MFFLFDKLDVQDLRNGKDVRRDRFLKGYEDGTTAVDGCVADILQKVGFTSLLNSSLNSACRYLVALLFQCEMSPCLQGDTSIVLHSPMLMNGSLRTYSILNAGLSYVESKIWFPGHDIFLDTFG